MGAVAELLSLKASRLDPLWTAYQAGTFGAQVLHASSHAATQAGEAYVKLSGEWFDVATRTIEAVPDGPEQDSLGAAIDQVVTRRTDLMKRGLGLKSELDSAFQGLAVEFRARLDALKRAVQQVVDAAGATAKKIGQIAPLILILVIAVVFSRRK
jgi:hypothetical protein